MPQILEAATGGEVFAEMYELLKSVVLCSTMTVRNVYTSDTLYSPEVSCSSCPNGGKANMSWLLWSRLTTLRPPGVFAIRCCLRPTTTRHCRVT